MTSPKEEREAYKRRTGPDKESIAMNLPAGKTCADCVHCYRCCSMFGHIPADEVCDWYPSRFQAAKGEERCECGYPMPCSVKVPITLCRANQGASQ